MKRIFLIAFFLITVTACASTQETPQPTFTSIPPTATIAPTQTAQPSPTPTPEPYYLENGILYDFDDQIGEYKLVGEGIDSFTTTAEGEIVAVDGAGIPRFVFLDGVWVEIKIPEGAENLVELEVADRYVAKVVDGKVEEVLESGLTVLVDPETGKYVYEKASGSWTEYNPRPFIVGDAVDDQYSALESGDVPTEIIESAVEMVLNVDEKELFTRNGEVVPLGFDKEWGLEEDSDGNKLMWWIGMNLGVGEFNHPIERRKGEIIYIGTLSLSGDVYVMSIPLSTERNFDFEMTNGLRRYESNEIPENTFDGEHVSITLGKLAESMASEKAKGVVMHIVSQVYAADLFWKTEEYNRMWGDWEDLMINDSEVQMSKDGYVKIEMGNMAMKDEVWAELGY